MSKGKNLRNIKIIILYFSLLLLTLYYVIDLNKKNQHEEYVEILKRHKEFAEIQKEFNKFVETDVAALISIKQPSHILDKRDELIRFLWGESELPITLPSTVIEAWEDLRYEDIGYLQRIDKLIVSMEFGLQSIVYHFIPQNPNNKVVIYHQGHNREFNRSKEQILQFIDNGYEVLGLSMPLQGLNNQPTIDFPRIGKLKISSHDHMKFLSPEKGHPIKYFIEPVVIVLNYLEKKSDYSSVSMIGLSGGGWTTTLAAAIDTRIKNSFPVAGSYPLYLRSGNSSTSVWGDYEQNNPELYKTVNYLELYVLGSYGNGRKQLQIINRYDPCCFRGTKSNSYKYIVAKHVQNLGAGAYDLYLDDSHHKHIVSNEAMNRVLKEIGGG